MWALNPSARQDTVQKRKNSYLKTTEAVLWLEGRDGCTAAPVNELNALNSTNKPR